MAFLTASTHENSFVANIAATFAEIKEKAQKRAMFRKTVRELNTLSGAELADLGLSRGSIRSTAFEAVYGK